MRFSSFGVVLISLSFALEFLLRSASSRLVPFRLFLLSFLPLPLFSVSVLLCTGLMLVSYFVLSPSTLHLFGFRFRLVCSTISLSSSLLTFFAL